MTQTTKSNNGVNEKYNFCTPALVFFCDCTGSEECNHFEPVEEGEGVCKWFCVGFDSNGFCKSEQAHEQGLKETDGGMYIYNPV